MTKTNTEDPLLKLTRKPRTRRAPEQLVADLQAEIEGIKTRVRSREAAKRKKADPAMRFTLAAVRSLDKAMSTAVDQVLRKALDEARGGLAAYLTLQGIVPAARSGGGRLNGRRSSGNLEQSGATLADYVKKNPGQRGEQITEALGMDARTMRKPMLQLIAAGAVRTKGERRGMRYFPA